MNQEKIGIFIKRKRIERGLTQEQLAINLNVSPKTVSRWERGLNIPDTSTLHSLSNELNVKVTELMLGKEEDNQENKNLNNDFHKIEIIKNKNKYKKLVLILLIISLIILLDVSYGYFSASLFWQIQDKIIFPKGIIFSMMFNQEINNEGFILTNMFYIFILILILNVILVLIYVILSLSTIKTKDIKNIRK